MKQSLNQAVQLSQWLQNCCFYFSELNSSKLMTNVSQSDGLIEEGGGEDHKFPLRVPH